MDGKVRDLGLCDLVDEFGHGSRQDAHLPNRLGHRVTEPRICLLTKLGGK